MRAVALALVASTLATTGCASRSTAGVAIGLGVVTAVTGVAIAASDDDEPPPNPNDAWAVDIDVAGPFGAGVALIGVALIATGVVSLAQISSHEEAAEASQPPVALADPSLDRDTLTAYEYARRGDCAAVAAIGATVRRQDPAYYRAEFASDPLLAPCLR